MFIKKDLIKFLKGSSMLSDNNEIYLCDNSSCYLKSKSGRITLFTENNILSKEIKEMISNTSSISLFNSINLSILEKESKRINYYKSFMIHKLKKDLYLISASTNYEFSDFHIKYAETSCKFINELI